VFIFEQQQYETCLKLETRSISVDNCSLLFTVTYSVAYLECAKGGGPEGLGTGKAPVGGMGTCPQKLTLFCQWMPKFWCFGGKN